MREAKFQEISKRFKIQISSELWAEPVTREIWIILMGLEARWACTQMCHTVRFPDWWLCLVGHLRVPSTLGRRLHDRKLLQASPTPPSPCIQRGMAGVAGVVVTSIGLWVRQQDKARARVRCLGEVVSRLARVSTQVMPVGVHFQAMEEASSEAEADLVAGLRKPGEVTVADGSSGSLALDVGNRENRLNGEYHLAAGDNREQQFVERRSSGQDQGRESAHGNVNVGVSASVGSVSVGGRNFNLPEHAAVLLKQAFEAMSNSSKSSEKQAEEISAKGKEVAMIESVENLSKPLPTADGAESSRQAATRKEGSGKSPYCFRCKTKGHAIEDCHPDMFCDICESQDHFQVRCPKFRVVKGVAVPCGFAVAGLGFFHIPHESSAKQRTEARSALISVTDGVLSVENVISELQRLIPGGWVWNVEAVW
jgi:hypothetical protein